MRVKRVITALVLLLAVTGGCVLSLVSSGRVFDRLIHLAATAEARYCDGDVGGAQQAAERLAEEFPRHTKLFALFLPHDELTDLEKSTAVLPLILRYGEPRDFVAEARRCRLMLERLWDQEKPLWENIL